MTNSFHDLIDQTYYFPQEGFDVQEGNLTFHGLSLSYLIKKHGTPLRLMYLPKIGAQVKKLRNLFKRMMKKHGYKGDYHYCYCTKCCHFAHVVKSALKHGVQIETSSSFDIDLIRSLEGEKLIKKDLIIVHNGHKTEGYLEKIIKLNEDGFHNSIIILDSEFELDRLEKAMKGRLDKIRIGIRMAVDEEPQSSYYTSRLGVPPKRILQFVQERIVGKAHLELDMLHFFVDSGIKDTLYYWGEFQKAVDLYVQLKKISPELNAFNLGGGFPIRNNLGFDYDYEHMISEMLRILKLHCNDADIQEPNIFTEFGKYTVGESGAVIFKVLESKIQNDRETWYMVDNSLMNTIPDAWSILEKFILLPINHWNKPYTNVNIGGISCDHSDYYNSEELNQKVYLPKIDPKDEPLYLGFFHTGAYQDAISGYGGIKHCLIPSPKYIVLDRNSKGDIVDHVYREEQTVDQMLSILGYPTK
jgi:arginine decarboxylase